jgi:hypothetical protein
MQLLGEGKRRHHGGRKLGLFGVRPAEFLHALVHEASDAARVFLGALADAKAVFPPEDLHP